MKRIIQFFQALKITLQLGPEKIVKLQKEVIRDPLTLLYNRRLLDEVGPKEVARANRYSRPFGLLIFDLDNLKGINDEYGHQMGDMVLKRIASVIQSHCRKSDFPFRVGGDEFLLLLPETSEKDAEVIGQRIITTLGTEDIQLSYGLGFWKKDFSFEEVFAEADRRLYQQKAEKKELKR